jgi:hypothetical protein
MSNAFISEERRRSSSRKESKRRRRRPRQMLSRLPLSRKKLTS